MITDFLHEKALRLRIPYCGDSFIFHESGKISSTIAKLKTFHVNLQIRNSHTSTKKEKKNRTLQQSK